MGASGTDTPDVGTTTYDVRQRLIAQIDPAGATTTHAYDSVGHAKTALTRYFDFYNRRRPHTTLDRLTPDQVYFNQPLPWPKAA